MGQWLAFLCVLELSIACAALGFRNQRLFLGCFMVLTALESTRDFAPSFGTTFAGLHLYPEDLFTVVALAAGLARIGSWRLRRSQRVAALAFGALVTAGVATWIVEYGLQTGVNSWRSQILALALLLYTTTRPRAWNWNDLNSVVAVPALVAAVASAAGLLAYGIGSSADRLQVNGVLGDSRPIAAPGALLLLAGLWVTVLTREMTRIWRVTLGILLASMVLLTQQRSVWAATILSGVAWWLAPRVRRVRPGSTVDGLARTVVVLFLGLITALVGSSVASLGQSASNDSTWLWRVDRWGSSMSIARSWLQWLVGGSLGPTPASSPTRFLTSAHSTYVDAVEMIGLIGLVAMLFLVVAIRRARVAPSSAPIGLVFCFALLAFGSAYQLLPWTWMMVGILLASPSRRPALPAAPSPAPSLRVLERRATR